MIKIMKCGAIIISVCLLMSNIAGCANEKKNANEEATPSPSSSTSYEDGYWTLLDKVSDTSDLPDWKGKEIKLRFWYGQGMGNLQQTESASDIVSPEIKRVTGVIPDVENSFDNQGQSFESKLQLMIASGSNYPDIGIGCTTSKLVKAGIIYDLTELLPKYCPNLYKKYPQEKLPFLYNHVQINGGDAGKIYVMPCNLASDFLPTVYDNVDLKKLQFLTPEGDFSNGYKIWIRDDILKQIYPNALSMNEIEDIYMKNGTFTEEQIFDIPMNSAEDFFDLCYKIHNLIKQKNLKEDGQPLEVMPGRGSPDNWTLFTDLSGFLYGRGSTINYFTYYDKKSKEIKVMFMQDWFKNEAKAYWKLIRDGVISKDSFVDNETIIQNKVSKGIYVINPLFNYSVDEEFLKKKGKKFRYRPINFNIPFDKDKYVYFKEIAATGGMAIFKESVKEEDLPQILRWYDYCMSDIGSKCLQWGPRTGGLWEEKNGKRIFKNKSVEECMVYSVPNGENVNYGLRNGVLPSANIALNSQTTNYYPVAFSQGDLNSPAYVYDRKRSKGDLGLLYKPAMFISGKGFNTREFEVPSGPLSYQIWELEGQIGGGLHKFWAARPQFETLLMQSLVAPDEETFNKLYDKAIEYARRFGLTDEVIKEADKKWKEVNAQYLEYLN